MAFTADQLLTFSDCQTLIDTESYHSKEDFTPSTELVTKTQMIATLHLDGATPLSTYTDSQHVRYGDITALGTLWAGGDYVCVDDSADTNPTAPTIYGNGTTSSSVRVDWANSPGSDDVNIYYYEIEISSDGGTVYGDSHIIQDILLGDREYTYTNLSASTAYKFRVKSIDSIGQESGWSNILSITTSAVSTTLSLSVSNRLPPAGNRIVYIDGPSNNDYITVELTVSSAGTTDPYDEWKYLKYDNGGSSSNWIEGEVDQSHPSTVSTVIYRDDSATQTVAQGSTYRTPTNFYGWAVATIKITNSSQGNSYDATAINFDIEGDSAP